MAAAAHADDLWLPVPEPIRLRTLVLLRWVAIAGQLAALLGALALGVRVAVVPVLAVIAASALANLAIRRRRHRPDGREAALHLGFDLAQLSTLIALTGGLSNPFAALIVAPAAIAATALDRDKVAMLAVATVCMISLAGLVAVPLRAPDGTVLAPPPLLLLGQWLAIVVAVGFVTAYAHRVAGELRATAEALAATRMALAREQKLQHLGGVVAAAAHELGTPLATIKLVAAELEDDLSDQAGVAADLALLRDSVDRCRDILRSMGRAGRDDVLLHRAPLSTLLAEAAAPHRDRRTIVIDLAPLPGGGDEPVLRRDAGVIHALRNLIQNAADFAASEVTVAARWDAATLSVAIADDGPGFPPAILARIGDPFLSHRRHAEGRPDYEGMGLGLFIAKTLLERSGAQVSFANRPEGGARSVALWARGDIDATSDGNWGDNPLITA